MDITNAYFFNFYLSDRYCFLMGTIISKRKCKCISGLWLQRIKRSTLFTIINFLQSAKILGTDENWYYQPVKEVDNIFLVLFVLRLKINRSKAHLCLDVQGEVLFSFISARRKKLMTLVPVCFCDLYALFIELFTAQVSSLRKRESLSFSRSFFTSHVV